MILKINLHQFRQGGTAAKLLVFDISEAALLREGKHGTMSPADGRSCSSMLSSSTGSFGSRKCQDSLSLRMAMYNDSIFPLGSHTPQCFRRKSTLYSLSTMLGSSGRNIGRPWSRSASQSFACRGIHDRPFNRPSKALATADISLAHSSNDVSEASLSFMIKMFF
ncbi:hypothetical protein CGGC5_v005299 [Colletotrichum fructicola Nara gc5]|uniref:Uncharacterized protein n=1 Tax=Colletotrichum fructicola (strain Nara gc5) TaxID=1213859 RepID=A0A7J6JAJ4_COLFN|nr:hypothetical protein CGGC5_v005299 [Colletotrichum fructicola Nara gc5]